MSKKILLADDSITIQKVVELTFSDGDYEVIATSNGTRAIEEIPRVKPDIILSDIIMPEKNGYELCEWVKSHPEYRNIPVILLTGTFEPFDPDRAEKAGCDAVVTKPFESQSLIQKVEELIARAGESSPSSAAAAPTDEPFASDDSSESVPPPFSTPQPPEQPQTMADAAPEMNAPPPPPPSFEMGEPEAAESSPFEGTESGSFQPEAESTPFPAEEEEPRPQGDIFSEQAAPDADEDPGATRIIPRMSMEDIERIRQERQDAESDEVPPPPSFEETAPPSMEMDSDSGQAPESEPMAPPSFDDDSDSSPFGAPPEQSSMEDDATRMIPKMSMEEIQRLQQESQQDEPQESDSSPFGDESSAEAAEDESPFAASEPSADMPPPAFESAGFGREEQQETTEDFDDSSTRMIPKMAFEDIQRMQQEEGQSEQSDQTPEQPESPVFGMGAPAPADDSAAANPFAANAGSDEQSFESDDDRTAPFSDEAGSSSFGEQEEPAAFEQGDSGAASGEEEAPAPFAEEAPELLPPPPHPPEEPVLQEPEPEATAGAVRADEPAWSGSLSEEQIDMIARRVVELLSDKIIREIAWEVIPETAEMVVKERIRELEGEER